MDRAQLYDKLAERKSKPKDFEEYKGDNGRVNKCVALVKSGKLRSGGTLLDIGGGIGDLGNALRRDFSRRITLDISEVNLKAARMKGNDTIQSDVDKHGFANVENNTVNLLTALDFIEHIIDPENFASECFRVLKQNGEVFINTPNIQFWPHIANLIGGKMPHTSGDREVYHGGHLAFFTYLDLQEIFGNAGFNGMEMFHDEEGFQQPPEWVLQMVRPRNQAEYVSMCERFGNPNLLFKAVKK